MAALVFPGFQALDYSGPIKLLGGFRDDIEVVKVAKTSDPVENRHRQRIVVDQTQSEGSEFEILFIPGGDSALDAAKDAELMQWVRETGSRAERVMSVCTGTVLLGMTGLLDGKRATKNKLDFTSTVHFAPAVEWIKKARWVRKGKFYTSSWVSAGMDVALEVGADLFGDEAARKIAEECEYVWHDDPNRDPFAKLAGLI